MGLVDRQRLLARLATDATLRARLATDLPATVAALGIAPEDASWLAALPADMVEEFAGSLIAKRLGEVAKLLPGTVRAMGHSRFADRFRRYADRPIPDGPRKHRDDAVDFAATVGRDPGDPPWVADLARLEASTLLALGPSRRPTACLLGHRPDDLAGAVGSGTTPGRRPSLVVWFRASRGGRPRRVVLTRPW